MGLSIDEQWCVDIKGFPLDVGDYVHKCEFLVSEFLVSFHFNESKFKFK